MSDQNFFSINTWHSIWQKNNTQKILVHRLKNFEMNKNTENVKLQKFKDTGNGFCSARSKTHKLIPKAKNEQHLKCGKVLKNHIQSFRIEMR